MQPVLMRFWQQHETWDGTYVVDDLIDLIDAAAEGGAHGQCS